MSSPYFLTSERLGFRHWIEEDLPLALDLWGDPRVMGLIVARERLSEDDVRERLLQEISTERAYGIQYWPTFLLASGEHVGCCGLRPYDEARRIFEFGFQIRTRHWGNGYATEVGRAVMAHAFGSLAARGLFAGHHPDNHASRRVLQKLGMRYTHDELYEPTGRNHACYLLTAEEHARTAQGEDA
jgi:RimJ/RimL family protein N-acetyltransferase